MDSTTGSYNIPENVSLEQEEQEELEQQEQQQQHQQQQSSPALPNVVGVAAEEEKEKVDNVVAPIVEPKSRRTHILRNLFFAQSGSPGNDGHQQQQGDSSKT